MKAWSIIISLLLAVVMTACGNDEPQRRPVEASISPQSLTLEIDQSAQLTVTGLDEFSLLYNSEIVAAEVTGNIVTVTALKAGETEMRIVGESVRLSCLITVLSPDDVPYDFTAELADNSERYHSHYVSLRYDNPGTFFNRFSDGTIEIVEIESGSHIEFNPDEKRLAENGQAVSLRSVTVEKEEVGLRWFHIVDSDGYHIVVVAETQ